MSVPLCDTCQQPLEMAAWLGEAETADSADPETVTEAVGRIDRVDFVCLQGHVQAEPIEPLRVVAVSADSDGVFVVRACPRP